MIARTDDRDALPKSRTQAETEAGIGVTPLEELQAKRHELVELNKQLWARYGPNGTWDARRKALLSMYAMQIADARKEADQPRLSDKNLDLEAHADKRYREWIKKSEAERGEFYVREDEIQQITEQIFRTQALIRYATAEPKT